MYTTTSITTPKRVIAFILLLNQLLTSCTNFNLPSKKEVSTIREQADQKRTKEARKVVYNEQADQHIYLEGDPPSPQPTENQQSLSSKDKKAFFHPSQQTNTPTPTYIPFSSTPPLTREQQPANKASDQRSIPFPVNKHVRATLGQMKDLELYQRGVKAKRDQVEQFGKLAKPLTFQDVTNPDTITPSTEETTELGSFSTEEGHQILFTHQKGIWSAIVKEGWPGGFSRQLNLPVYLEPGFTIEDITKHIPAWQKNHIQIILPEQLVNGEGYVYIGRRGFLGGGNEASKGSSSGAGRDHTGSEHSHASSKYSSNDTSSSSKPSSSKPSSSNKTSSGGNTFSNSTTHITIPHVAKDTPISMPRGVEAYLERAAESSKESSSSSIKSSGESGGASRSYLKEVNKMRDKLDRCVLGMTMGWQDRPTAFTPSHDIATSSKPETGQQASFSFTQRSNTVEAKSKELFASQQQGNLKQTVAPKEDKPTVSSNSTTSYFTSSSPRSRSPIRHSPIMRSSSPAISKWESEQDKEEKERITTQKEWDQLEDEIQNKFSQASVSSLPEAYEAQRQIQSYIEKVKAYAQHSYLSSSTQQLLKELDKVLYKLGTIVKDFKDIATYDKLIDDINERLGKENEEFNKVQAKKNAEEIIAKAQEFKIHVKNTIKQLEEFKTKRDKRDSLTKLRENLQTLEEVIQLQSEKKEWLAKYNAAIELAGQHIAERIEQEKEHLCNQAKISSDNYTINIEPKPGVTLPQIKAMFSGENNTKVNLQNLLDSLNIKVNFSSKEEESEKPGVNADQPEAATMKESKEEVKEQETKRYSINVEGIELNREGFVLNNPHMAENITKLYQALVQELGTKDFKFQVIGGDRYKGEDGKVYSSTDHTLIEDSGPAHIRGNAVDLLIRLADDSDIIPVEIVKRALEKTAFIFDPNAMPRKYPNKHYHLQFPKSKDDTK